jgi:serine/threonine protein kinase
MVELDGFEDFVEIGRGGFGVVYRARQPALNRFVAIKFLAMSLNTSGRERLSREAQAMGALSGHPNIVPVVDVGIPVDGEPYLVMPYFAKGSLAGRLASSGTLPWLEVVRIGVKLAGALESAHRLGMLHRDVKPGNILISDYGEPQLADFGLARVAGSFETTTRHITASVAHAAPEILEGRAPSAAADIYSLASTLYTLAAGTPAFTVADDESLVSLYVRIASAPVPDLRRVGVPEPLCSVLEAAMSKRPEERPASAAAFGRLLQDVEASAGRAVTELPLVEAPQPPAATDTVPLPGVSGPTRVAVQARPRHRRGSGRLVWAAVPAAGALVVAGVIVAQHAGRGSVGSPTSASSQTVHGSATSPVTCLKFGTELPWYQRIDDLPVDPSSADYIASVSSAPGFKSGVLHAGFGSDTGTTYNVITGAVANPLKIEFDSNDAELASDPGPYPIPPNAVGRDEYLIVVDDTSCISYEVYGPDDTRPWTKAEKAATFNLNQPPLRRDNQPSAIQSGLPLFPMLVRYDEVASGEMKHALLVNAPVFSAHYVHPATMGIKNTQASGDPKIPPVGSRLRLKSEYDCAKLSTTTVQTICKALKTYGMFLAGSSGSLFELQGVVDSRWSDDSIHADFALLAPRDFEAVKTGEPIR